ncbi:hypothetical protein MMC13_000156 [Lambiella insularis]|nr:hypothetical protein [Lambiella insularis]
MASSTMADATGDGPSLTHGCSSSSSAYTSSLFSSTWSSSIGSESNIFMPSKTDSDTPEGKVNMDMKLIFDTLWRNKIPGPRLLRANKEFTTRMGGGAQGYVYAASDEFMNAAVSLSYKTDRRMQDSLKRWTTCVIKRIRNDGKQDLRQQVRSTYSEVLRLCHDELCTHDNIVKLVGWGLCLDSLETPSSEDPRLPLLLLERADCDLDMFMNGLYFSTLSLFDIEYICLGIGRGLGAVHAAGFAHGDIKPMNVLMFHSRDRNTQLGSGWTPKLCDFGSSNVKQYLGSRGWQPPEFYEQDKDNLLDSLLPCDIFAYGVLISAIFSGKSASPLDDIGDLDRDEIRRRSQRQCFYHQAASAVRHGFRVVLPIYAPILMETEVNRSSPIYASVQMETEVNRVLLVLRSSLNHDRNLREGQPWRYFNSKRFPKIARVEDPAEIPEMTMLSARIARTFTAPLPISAHFQVPRLSLIEVRNSIIQRSELLYRSISSRIKRKSDRQRTFEYMRPRAANSTADSFSINELSIFDHPDGDHDCSVHSIFGGIRGQTLPEQEEDSLESMLRNQRPGQFEDYLYSIGRLRSRFRLSCWQKTNDNTNSIECYLRRGGHDIAILAWLCRGEIGEQDLLRLGEQPDLLWNCTNSNRLTDDERTASFLLFMEKGCNIAQKVGSNSRTAFGSYLWSLQDDTQAILICRHFKRLAELDNIIPSARFYLTGQPSDLADEQETYSQAFSTTALHEAVRASNYDVVEYLVRTDFVVDAEDQHGMKAIDIAMELGAKRDHIQSNRIVALLNQRHSKVSADQRNDASLPIGWETIVTSSGTKVYKETSIRSDTDAVTFIVPRAGLLEDKRLVVGERKVKGLGQPYLLDPLRFMSSRAEEFEELNQRQSDYRKEFRFSGTRRLRPNPSGRPLPRESSIAKEPHYNDSWYQKELEATASPPAVNLLEDERSLIRIPSRVLLGLSIIVAGVRYRDNRPTFVDTGVTPPLAIISATFSGIVSVFYTTRIAEVPIETAVGVIILSRTVAIVSLILCFGIFVFRYKTHANLFEEEQGESPSEEEPDILLPWAAVSVMVTSAIFLAICCDALSQAVMQFPTNHVKLLGMLFIPAAIKNWTHAPAVTYALRNRLNYTLDWTVGCGLVMSWCVAPSFVLLGWVIGVPMTLHFGLLETVAYGLAAWIVTLVIRHSAFSYLKGIALVLAFVLMALGFVIQYS